METKKFKVFGEPFTLQYVTCIINPDNPELFRWGETDNIRRLIRVSTESVTGVPVPKRTQEITKWHELMHCALDEGQYCAESQNEALVEWLAKCIVSFKEQGL